MKSKCTKIQDLINNITRKKSYIYQFALVNYFEISFFPIHFPAKVLKNRNTAYSVKVQIIKYTN